MNEKYSEKKSTRYIIYQMHTKHRWSQDISSKFVDWLLLLYGFSVPMRPFGHVVSETVALDQPPFENKLNL